jgi:gas vesicle protein GvpA/GvpJ/GvpM family
MRSKSDQVLDLPEASVLDVLDHVLSKGVLASGDVTLGVAGIDLIYLRLSAILCAADRVLPSGDPMLASRRRRGRTEAPPESVDARRRKPDATKRRKTRR